MATLSKPTAADQKATQGKTNYVSVSDGAGGFVWIIDDTSVSAAVTAQSGSHAFNQTSTTNPSGSFIVTFPQPFSNPPVVEVAYQWNYNASTNGTALSPPILIDGAPSTTGFSYRINGNRNALDRVLWTAVDPLTTIQAGNQALTPRAITGSVTSVGYDGIELPYKIALTAGQVLSTVSLNGTATTNFDANTGIVRITPNGAPVAVTHTTAAGASYNGLQRVNTTTTALTITASNQNYTLGIVPQEGDLLEVGHTFNNSGAEAQFFWVRVAAGTTQRAFPWADPNNNTHYFTFPATLTDTFQVRQAVAGSSPRISYIKVWRDSANGYCVPTGTVTRTACNVSVNGGANQVLYGGTSGRLTAAPAAGKKITAVTASAGLTVSIADPFGGALEVAVVEGTTTGTITTTEAVYSVAQDYYLGTWNNQAGHSGDTNGGHTYTRQKLLGTRITTSNDSTLTLSGGMFKVRVGITRHQAYGSWINTGLYVDGTGVENMYTGHDGSNWPGGSTIEWLVDATSANKTVQTKRDGANGNGNTSGYLEVELLSPVVVPQGYQTRVMCTLTAGSGTFLGGSSTATIPTDTGQNIGFTVPNGQVLQSVASNNANVTVGSADPKTGMVYVAVANAATAATLTPTFATSPVVMVNSIANSGIDVQLGNYKIRIAGSGNRAMMISTVSGSATLNGQSNYFGPTGHGFQAINNLAVSTTPVYVQTTWNFGNAADSQRFAFTDGAGGVYEFEARIGSAYNNCGFSMIRLS